MQLTAIIIFFRKLLIYDNLNDLRECTFRFLGLVPIFVTIRYLISSYFTPCSYNAFVICNIFNRQMQLNYLIKRYLNT